MDLSTPNTFSRRKINCGLVLGSLLASRAAKAQGEKVPRVGILWHAANAQEERLPLSSFRQGLNDIGYIEGKNIVLEMRFPAERPELFIKYAAELADMNVDLIVTVGRRAAFAAKRATTTIPILFMTVADPVGSKLVETLSRPGQNITGLSNMALELTPKRIELLKETAGLTRAALLVGASDPETERRFIEVSKAAVNPLGIFVEGIELRSTEDFIPAFERIKSLDLQGVVLTQDGLIYSQHPKIFQLAVDYRLPAIGYTREMATNGAFMAYGPNNAAMFRRAAILVDKVLKHTKSVSDIPVEQPDRIEFLINTDIMQKIGIEIPPIMMSRATDFVP